MEVQSNDGKVVTEKYNVFVFDQPDKYIQIARAKLNSSNKAESPVAKKAPKRRSVFHWLQNQWSVPRDPICTKESILTTDTLEALHFFLPLRFQIGQSSQVFNSLDDGVSIQNFLHKMGPYCASLIAVKTSRNEVFGAFCSTSWKDRHESKKDLKFFGTGETFLFCCSPKFRIFPWVGWTRNELVDAPVELSSSLFLAANSSTIVIGGGGDSGIRFLSDLSRGYTGPCSTFNSPPLCDSRDFLVAVIEAYGLNY
ncbi:GTPase-activating protein skywalker-like [Paramacrobiotus metropolitanus]|uniref:GTPase-activating protein skywalker-like n=1 Tax=Paramacrobiotus metropolitanus TaxID=2943436 RepID=UPI0024457BD6|nr:GTPase-activating protein skywalker-like [Paramacrobiotus metropolitanus]